MDVPFDPGVYFNNPSFSDITVRFSDKEIKGHRILLCKSTYFKKAIGQESQWKASAKTLLDETTGGVLELREDDPSALEQMLRYIYTSTYPHQARPYSRDKTWEDHFNVMIVADKYGLPRLEELASGYCTSSIRRTPGADDTLRGLIERSWDFSDRDQRFKKFIASLPCLASDRFPELFKDTDIQAWLDANRDVADPLIERHFEQLLAVPCFREKLSSDPEMSLRHLERLQNALVQATANKRLQSPGPLHRSSEYVSEDEEDLPF